MGNSLEANGASDIYITSHMRFRLGHHPLSFSLTFGWKTVERDGNAEKFEMREKVFYVLPRGRG